MLTALLSALRDGELSIHLLIYLAAYVFVTLCCLPVHESAHAWMADRLGDSTGRLHGRITLNPLAHLSLLGTLMMFLFGVGYAKPVPVNIRNFKKKKQYFALTALAGPVSNIILAVFFTLIRYLVLLIPVLFEMKNSVLSEQAATVINVSNFFFYEVAYTNTALAVFNLIPIPPLDGSRLLTALLPDRIYYKIMQYERYSMYILLGLIFIFNRIGFSPIDLLAGAVFEGVNYIVGLPFISVFG